MYLKRNRDYSTWITVFAAIALLGQPAATAAAAAASDASATAQAIKLPEKTEDIQLPPMTSTEKKIFDLVQSGQYVEAQEIIKSGLHESQDKQERTTLLQLQAYIDLELDKTKDAIRGLETLSRAEVPDDVASIRSQVLTFKRLGNIYLRNEAIAQAIDNYNLALAAAQKLPPGDPALTEIREALVGSLLQQGNFASAKPHAEKLVETSEMRARSGELFDIATLFWSYIQLAQIYKQTDPEKYTALMAKALPFFDKLLSLRTLEERDTVADTQAVFKKVQSSMMQTYIAENEPATIADYLWLAKQFRMQSLPLIRWQTPASSPKAVILCIHGLGLENRAFTPFARKMTDKNFTVYALDVRGFGAWQSQYGTQTVDFDRALKDISAVITMIKSIHPGVPVFLLGESMGGAIALRAASEFGSDMDGVISSVPSAERYGEKQMATQVAKHFLRNPKKPFDIGKSVVDRATSKENLRELWENDPKAKIELSPLELMKFDRFMTVTKARCSAIRSTPVMVVQGMEDSLVKPQGTYEMYDRINSPDKTMIIIGNAEHLIFETMNQSQVLIDGLAAWLDNHLTHHQASSTASPSH